MTYRIGVGKYDITGPGAEVGFMGMSNIEQQGKGIHMRLFARSFIIVDEQEERIAIVVADLAKCSQAVKLEVVRRLKEHPKLQSGGQPLYCDDNVMITATHTHSGPGGYSHYLAYNASIPGFNEQNFEVIVTGIVESIHMAHGALKTGLIYLEQGKVSKCGGNRSRRAYRNNPEEERQQYDTDIDEDMVLLKFQSEAGEFLGILNWCALHPTTMGETNHLISGDHKGVASYLFEKDMPSTFVAAFANSNCGDQSPNVKYGARPDGIHDIENTLEIGIRQYRTALGLYQSASRKIWGKIAYRHAYVDMSDRLIQGTGKKTWPAAMGYGMLQGSSEDSEGFKSTKWGEGTTTENFEPDLDLRLELIKRLAAPIAGVQWPEDDDLPTGYEPGHAEKPIVFHVGLANYKGIPLVPHILPLQMFKIGPLVIVGHPGEMTTMAGRRMRKTVQEAFESEKVGPIVIAAYANAYSGYTTTREEYAVQNYEGASTLFGPWTLAAYQQEQQRLAESIRDGTSLTSQFSPLPVHQDQVLRSPLGQRKADSIISFLSKFGSVKVNVRPSYQRGQRAIVTFVGGYPNHDLRTGKTYLTVECKEGNDWNVVYDDHDFCTFFRWEPGGLASRITIEWHIPCDQPRGLYRLRYFGHYRALWSKLKPIEGVSGEFAVV